MAKNKDVEKLELELALESNNFNKQMTAINKQIKKSEQDFKRAGQGVEGFEKTFVGLDTKIKKTSSQLELYSQKLEKQKSKYKELESTVERQKSKLNELENTLGKGSDEWKKQAQLVQQNSSKLVKLSTDIGKTENSINGLEVELKQAQNEFQGLNNKTKTVAEQLSKVDEEAALAESEFQRLGSELNSTGQSTSKFKNEMSQLESKISSGQSKINIYENAIKKLSMELTQSKTAHNKLANEVSQTENKLSQAQNEFGQNSTEAQQLRTKLLSLKDSYNSLETEIEQNQAELNRYQTELNQTQTEVNQLSRDLRQMPFEEVGSKMQKVGQGTKEVGQALTTGVTVPIAAAGTAATIAGTKFDTSMSKLQATSGIADKTSESYVKLRKKALEMGSSTSFSASEAADGLTYLALAGWDVETQIARIEPVLRAAEAGGMDLAVTSDKITDSMSSASIESKDFAKYLDIVAQAQRKSNTSMEQMLDAYVGAGGIFSSLNIPLEESAALLGILANRGTKGSEAANSLISVFSNLITETGQAGTALDKLNISLYDSDKKQRNVVDVLKEMAKKLGVAGDETSNLTEQQKQQYAAMVGGKTQFDTLMKLLAGVSGEYDELKGHLDNSNGALNEMATIMKDNLGGQMDSMKSAIEGALIKAFQAMLPVLETVVGMITDAANWFSSLDEEQQKNIVTIAAVVACIGPLLMGLGQLIIVGGNAVTLFGGLSAGAGAAAGASSGLASAMGILAGPVGIGLAIAALVGLMAYVGDSENSLLKLQEKFGSLGTIIGSVCEFISGIIQMTFGNMIIYIGGAMDAIAALLDGPGGQTLEDAQTRMQNRLIINTEEAMGKLTITTTRGMSQMRHMTEQELGGLISTTDIIMQQLPFIAEKNYQQAGTSIATQLQSMDSNQLLVLKGMNDTTKALFQGINQNMTVEQMSNQVQVNMKQMAATGKFEADTMSKDISSAMDTLKQQVETKTKQASTSANTNTTNLANNINTNTQQASQNADKNTQNLAQKVDNNTKNANSKANANTQKLANDISKNTQQAAQKADTNTQNLGSKIDTNTKSAGAKTDTNTKELASKIDANTKDATNKAEANMKNMASKADKESKNTSDNAVKNANIMKDKVSSATKQMADNAIRDWNRIKNEYAKGITGKVNITKTTTNVIKTQNADTFEALNSISKFDLSGYQTDGAYYRSKSKTSMLVTENNLNMDLRKIEELLANKRENLNIHMNFNFDKIEIKNEDDYKTMAKKVASYVDIELNKIKNKNKKIKGRLVNA